MLSIKQQLDFPLYDVIVIGGGPAGSTAAGLLAEKGWSVCVLEKDRHPRFHIGESLLPMNLPIFERLGVIDQVKDIGVKKNAAEFNAPDTRRPIDTFYFGESLTDNPSYAYQVLRADLDWLLLDNARKKGAIVIEQITVSEVELAGDPKRVQATDAEGNRVQFECRFLVDASGRDSFLATKLNLKRKNKKHRSAAIFRHYRNVKRRTGGDSGNISIYWIEHGWIWLIPLQNDIMSIGAVLNPDYLKTRQSSLDDFLWTTLNQVPDIHERLEHAHPAGATGAAANYSYTASRMVGDGYLLIGDAFAFIDPVFSSGVFLAMQSAELGSEVVDMILRRPELTTRAVKNFERKIHIHLQSFSWFIYRFNHYAMRQLLMHNPGIHASQHFRKVKAAVISVFSGKSHRHRRLRLPLLIFRVNYYVLNAIDYCKRLAAFSLARSRIDASNAASLKDRPGL
ncbi:MAG: NAD(P)/FAD-dependent oxidoreductase [Methylococcales bacterium]